MTDLAGVVLAGGLSRRMGGGDKGLLPLGKTTLLGQVIQRLHPQVSHMVLNANGDPARFADYGLPVVADSIEGFAGPLAGVLAGMDWAATQGISRIITVAADTPFFPDDLVECLLAGAAAQNTPLAMAVTPDLERGQARHPTFGLWDVALRDDLRMALNDGLRKVVLWTNAKGCAQVKFPLISFDPFFNVNTPEDITTATQLLEENGL